LGERLCKGAMLSFLHKLALSLLFFKVLKSYNKPILCQASCGNKTTIVTSRGLVILVEPSVKASTQVHHGLIDRDNH